MSRKRSIRLLPTYLVLSFFLLLILLPIIGLVFAAFKTDVEVIKGPFTLPTQIRFDSFKDAWITGRFNYFFRNSVFVTVVVVIVSVFLSTLTGYAFGMLPVPGRKWLFPCCCWGTWYPLRVWSYRSIIFWINLT